MIELRTATATCTIDPQGAWVTHLAVREVPVLFERTAVNYPEGTKSRGGMHVCLPNFGPDRDGSLAQHGFGRTETWDITEQSDASVTLRLVGGHEEYKNLKSTLTYVLDDDGFSATLRLENQGSTLVRVAPGFHPYFDSSDTEEIVVNETTFPFTSLPSTKFVSAETAEVTLGKQTYMLRQTEMPAWAIWTDQKGDYVCVEPTVGGFRFMDDPDHEELLQPDQEKLYTLSIGW